MNFGGGSILRLVLFLAQKPVNAWTSRINDSRWKVAVQVQLLNPLHAAETGAAWPLVTAS
jgi:hypothetical protein